MLYHEIGHHIHQLETPGYRANKETVAEEWREKLMRSFLLRRYWYLAWLVWMFQPLIRPLHARLKAQFSEEDA